jgi:xylulokinase
MYLLGLDIGSSSVKASLVEVDTKLSKGTAQSPATEMAITALQPDWAEQDPELWWEHCRLAIQQLLHQTSVAPDEVAAIGIAYQMHGLVLTDRDGAVLRPSIIWCDSRAVSIGENAFDTLGHDYCLSHYLNSPGNFTASKLKWVADHEPALFERIHHLFLPGDYLAFRMTGEAHTTISGLSEGVLWDFAEGSPAQRLMAHYGIRESMIPDVQPSFGLHGVLANTAAAELGLKAGTPVTYRAGDQPNNALSLNVMQPGEVAATGGTSGVVYGVVDRLAYDPLNRVNSFAHVNHTAAAPRIGVLLCINGAGSLYSWMRKQVAGTHTPYSDMERMAATVPSGSEGLRVLPFGNGAERLLGNRNPGAQVLNLQFNRHGQAHLYRAALEGVAYAFVYGMKAMQELGLNLSVIRAGNDNMFQSPIFAQTIANLLGCRIELMRSTGATGAAFAAGVGVGLWPDVSEVLGQLELAGVIEPDSTFNHDDYQHWHTYLNNHIL